MPAPAIAAAILAPLLLAGAGKYLGNRQRQRANATDNAAKHIVALSAKGDVATLQSPELQTYAKKSGVDPDFMSVMIKAASTPMSQQMREAAIADIQAQMSESQEKVAQAGTRQSAAGGYAALQQMHRTSPAGAAAGRPMLPPTAAQQIATFGEPTAQVETNRM